MLDVKWAREHISELSRALKNRNAKIDLGRFVELDKERRRLLTEVEEKKHKRNLASQKIAELKRKGESAERKLRSWM